MMSKNFYFVIVLSFLVVESFNCKTVRLQLPAGIPYNGTMVNMCTAMAIDSNETLVVENTMAYHDSKVGSNAPEVLDLFACSNNLFKDVNISKSQEQTTWMCGGPDALNVLYNTCKMILPSPTPRNGLLPTELGYSVGGTTGCNLLIMLAHFHKHHANKAEEMKAEQSFVTPNAVIQISLRPFSEVPNHVIDPQVLLITLSGDEIPPLTHVQVEHAYSVNLSTSAHVFAFAPHTHLIGTEEYLSIKKKDGHEMRLAAFDDPLNPDYRNRTVRIRDFDIEQGDQVIVSCKYENNSTLVIGMSVNGEVCIATIVFSTDSPRVPNMIRYNARAETTVLGHIN